MSAAELLGEPDRLAFLLLVALVLIGIAAVAPPTSQAAPADPVTTWPYLVRLELVAALATLLVTAWWAIGLPLPLGPPADPAVTPAQAKAPWFFVGIQELLQYFDPWLAGVVLPLLGLVGLAALPYLDSGREPARRGAGIRPAALVALLALLGLWLVPTGVGLFLRGDNWSWQPLWRSAAPADEPLAVLTGSLGERLGLGRTGAGALGAGLCLGPFALLGVGWRLWRERLGTGGRGRYLLAGSLLILLGSVALKVLLVAVFHVRYLWVTPWFRI